MHLEPDAPIPLSGLGKWELRYEMEARKWVFEALSEDKQALVRAEQGSSGSRMHLDL